MTSRPDWLNHLAEEVAELFISADVLSPLGCHYYHNQATDEWEITLFASKTETVGGHRDGMLSSSKFSLDLKSLVVLFSEVANLHWQALTMGSEDELGPHVSLEGVYLGQTVWLRILATAPERFEAGRYMKVHEFRLEDRW